MLDWLAWTWMAILPGAWLVFAAPSRLDGVSRVALCAAFSPFAVSLAFLALRLLGMPAPAASWSLAGLTLPAAGLVVWRLRAHPKPAWPAHGMALALLLLVPLAWLVAHWLAAPNLRLLGWHNLMHLDIVYELVRSPPWPEEPELAGAPLTYAWIGHGYFAVLGLLTDRPPTRVYPVTHAVLLLATSALLYRTARALRLAPPAAGLAALLGLLGSHLALELARLLGTPGSELRATYGDARLVAPLYKFLYLDVMPASIALSAALLRLSVTLRSSREPAILGLALTVLLALAISYPIALPPALGLVGSFFAFCAWQDERSGALRLGVLFGAGLLLLLGTWSLHSGNEAAPALAALTAPAVAGRNAVHAAVALAPFLLLATPACVRALSRREAVPLACAATVLGLIAAFALLSVRGLEYKFIVYARLPLALLVAGSLAPWLPAGRTGWARVAAAVLALAGLGLSSSLARPQSHLAGAPPLLEDHFLLSVAPESPHRGWLDALREGTPPDTVLVASGLDFHAGALANRALYFPCDDGAPQPSAGYGLPNVGNLAVFRGHPKELLRQRRRDVRALLGSPGGAGRSDALARMQALGRPLALLVPHGSPALSAWLQDRGRARSLHRDAYHELWLVDRGASRS